MIEYEVKEFHPPRYVCMYFNEVSEEVSDKVEALDWLREHDPEEGYPYIIVKTKEIRFVKKHVPRGDGKTDT